MTDDMKPTGFTLGVFGDPLATFRPQDRVEVPCPKCKGAGRFRRPVLPEMPTRLFAETDPTEMDDTVEIVEEKCGRCKGEGFIQPKDGERVDIRQSGRIVGSCTVPAKVRPHLLVDQRPGDYVPKLVDGRMIYEADRMLCPGDLEQLEGFSRHTAEQNGEGRSND